MKIDNILNLLKRRNERVFYFDTASAERVDKRVAQKFLELQKNFWANPSSIHAEGEKCKQALTDARKKISLTLKCKGSNIYFTGSATEANNIFIKGVFDLSLSKSYHEDNSHIIYTKSDHSSIVEVVNDLKRYGVKTTSVGVNSIGLINIDELISAIQIQTKIICFSYVNSEIGTIQEVRKIALAVREKSESLGMSPPKIFIDASQATHFENLDTSTLLVDGMSFGTAKLGFPQGLAVLYKKFETKLFPFFSGGGQEQGVRSGTENLPLILTFSEYFQIIRDESFKSKEYVFSLRNYFIKKIQENFTEKEVEIFGDKKFKYNKFFEHASPHIVLVHINNMLGEEACLRLDAKGFLVSPGTACSLIENSGSNFLMSIGEPIKAKEVIRISLTYRNSEQDVNLLISELRDIVNKFAK